MEGALVALFHYSVTPFGNEHRFVAKIAAFVLLLTL